jgi:hypothetical protein
MRVAPKCRAFLVARHGSARNTRRPASRCSGVDLVSSRRSPLKPRASRQPTRDNLPISGVGSVAPSARGRAWGSGRPADRALRASQFLRCVRPAPHELPLTRSAAFARVDSRPRAARSSVPQPFADRRRARAQHDSHACAPTRVPLGRAGSGGDVHRSRSADPRRGSRALRGVRPRAGSKSRKGVWVPRNARSRRGRRGARARGRTVDSAEVARETQDRQRGGSHEHAGGSIRWGTKRWEVCRPIQLVSLGRRTPGSGRRSPCRRRRPVPARRSRWKCSLSNRGRATR